MNQVMSKEILTVDKSITIQEAANKMKSMKIGCVIITEKNKEEILHPIGILTERDFVTRIAAEGRPLFTEVSSVMSQPLITVESEETVWEASEIMKERSIHKLPVRKNDNIIGIITTTDIVKISSLGSDSQMRRICDQILLRINEK